MPNNIPVLFASLLNSSHLGTLFVQQGGKEAVAATAFLDWKAKGDQTKKYWFCPQPSGPSTMVSPLIKDGWEISSKNGMC
jgi:hypothetical protein